MGRRPFTDLVIQLLRSTEHETFMTFFHFGDYSKTKFTKL